MPASQFFVMLESSRFIRNREQILSCYVARSGGTTAEGFDSIIEYFNELDLPKVRPPHRQDEENKFCLKGEDAKDVIFGVFWNDRTINRDVKH